MTLGLAIAAVLASPLVNSADKVVPVEMAGPNQGEGGASVIATEQARFEFRRGEWYGGNCPTAADLSEQARLVFRRYEWPAGVATSTSEQDLEQARLYCRAAK